MDVESKDDNKSMTATDVARRHEGSNWRRRNICIALIAVVITLGLVFLILGLTVFKAKKPITTVNSVSLKDMDLSLDIARMRANLNVTIGISLTVKNPNAVGFKYTGSSVLLKYRDTGVVGEAPVPAGEIGSRSSSPMNISLTVMADRLLSDPNLFRDLRSGTLPFTTYLKLTGKVKILFNIKVKSTTTCDVDIDVFNRAVARQSCNYRTNL